MEINESGWSKFWEEPPRPFIADERPPLQWRGMRGSYFVGEYPDVLMKPGKIMIIKVLKMGHRRSFSLTWNYAIVFFKIGGEVLAEQFQEFCRI